MAQRSVPQQERVLTLQVLYSAPEDIGILDGGLARMIPIIGGTVSGAISGAGLPGGADWSIICEGGLCIVDARGRSTHVCHGYLRVRLGEAGADGTHHISIACWPTAYSFARGHRLRPIVTGGAFPRYARNLGSGEALATGTSLLPTHQEIVLVAGSRLRFRVVPG